MGRRPVHRRTPRPLGRDGLGMAGGGDRVGHRSADRSRMDRSAAGADRPEDGIDWSWATYPGDEGAAEHLRPEFPDDADHSPDYVLGSGYTERRLDGTAVGAGLTSRSVPAGDTFGEPSGFPERIEGWPPEYGPGRSPWSGGQSESPGWAAGGPPGWSGPGYEFGTPEQRSRAGARWRRRTGAGEPEDLSRTLGGSEPDPSGWHCGTCGRPVPADGGSRPGTLRRWARWWAEPVRWRDITSAVRAPWRNQRRS